MNLDHHIRLDESAVKSANLCHRFTERDLATIASKVYQGYELDKSSRSAWKRRTQAAMDLAMQVSEAKTFPWPNASNVIFPLVTIAALQFHSRAYPTIVPGPEVVKCRVAGFAAEEDLIRADRVGRHMSYQVMEEDSAWEEQHDRLLINVPIVGCAFKKSYYNGTLGHNVSELVLAQDFVIHYFAKDVSTARRKTHIVPQYRNDIWEKCAAGLYRDVRDEPWFKKAAQPIPSQDKAKEDNRSGIEMPSGDEDAPLTTLESHVWLDLDGDGYEEPYIVLIEETSKAVLRIVSRVDRIEDVLRGRTNEVISIRAAEYFTKYSFIPSPDGSIYDIGFGVLLGPLNESVNTLINQLIDAGTMATTAGGFLGRGAKIRGGQAFFTPLEWKRLDATGDDIKKNIFPLPVREPSDVLFKLLGLLIDYTNRISGATEMLTGQNPGQNTPASTSDHMVEQGLKIYAAIFKRIWRSMKEEFKKLYILNAINMPAHQRLFNGMMAYREDYLGNPDHIVPMADPNVVSDTVKMQQAAFIAQRAITVPGYDIEKVERNLLLAARVDAVEAFYPGPKKTGPLPNVKLQVEQEKTRREQLKLKHQAEDFLLEIEETHNLNEAKIQQLEAAATNLLAQAKGVDVTAQINAINAAVGAMKEHQAALHKRAEVILKSMESNDGQASHAGAIRHLVGGPGNSGAAGDSGGSGGGAQGGMGAGGLPQ